MAKPANSPGFFLYGTNLDFFDEYSNNEDAEYVLRDQGYKFSHFDVANKLFMLNGTLTRYMTPHSETSEAITWNYNTVKELADKINPMMDDDVWFKYFSGPNNYGHIVNIIQHDFVGQMDVVRRCQEVMRKNKTAIGS